MRLTPMTPRAYLLVARLAVEHAHVDDNVGRGSAPGSA